MSDKSEPPNSFVGVSTSTFGKGLEDVLKDVKPQPTTTVQVQPQIDVPPLTDANPSPAGAHQTRQHEGGGPQALAENEWIPRPRRGLRVQESTHRPVHLQPRVGPQNNHQSRQPIFAFRPPYEGGGHLPGLNRTRMAMPEAINRGGSSGQFGTIQAPVVPAAEARHFFPEYPGGNIYPPEAAFYGDSQPPPHYPYASYGDGSYLTYDYLLEHYLATTNVGHSAPMTTAPMAPGPYHPPSHSNGRMSVGQRLPGYYGYQSPNQAFHPWLEHPDHYMASLSYYRSIKNICLCGDPLCPKAHPNRR